MHDTHQWIKGARQAGCAQAAAACEPNLTVSCHRRLRGPYTGTGSLMRALVPAVHALDPDLVTRHASEILAVAPELEPLVGAAPETLTSIASPAERTRWYSRYRTRRIAHGIVDFLKASAGDKPLTLVFSAVDHADPTDLEFLSIALRRLDPGRVRLVVCSNGDLPAIGDELTAYTKSQVAADAPGSAGPGTADVEQAAAAFVASDGTSDVPGLHEGYLMADPALRERLHDERAAELTAQAQRSLGLGAIAYHREHGSAPAIEGRHAYEVAVDYCIGMAYYDAALELADRLAPLIDSDADPRAHYVVRTQMCQCLAPLERPAETEPIYYELLERSANPRWHMSISYALAMLYTRMYSPEHKDHRRALALVNTAVAIASQLDDPDERVFHTVFMNNGKALVAMHLGNLPESLRLVNEGISRLDRELGPDKHRLHRSVLYYNRGQVLASLGRPDEALADFARVIEDDPHYPEYRFDRGNLFFKLGRYDEALADYAAADKLGPPFPELYYNRADVRAATGDLEGALNDFRYVLDLEPDYLEARVTLASLLLDAGDPEAAVAQARAGLAADPDEARLHCTLGLALLAIEDNQSARDAFDRALELDPTLSEAMVNRAIAAYELADYACAMADLDAALAADAGNPDLLLNRGLVHEAAGRPAEAAADYTLALQHDQADRAALDNLLKAASQAVLTKERVQAR